MKTEAKEDFLAGQLIVATDQVSPLTSVSTVYDIFSDTPELEALALVEEGKPVGLITRSKMLFMLSRRFGFELHSRHPIISIAETAPLTVTESEVLDVVIEKACARAPKDIYDEVVVTSPNGRYLGLLSLKELVVKQGIALARTVVLNEVATARTEELERVNLVKSQFLANVTHELRSPVNAILGLVHLLTMSAQKEEMGEIRERLGFLLATASNLRTVITNILDLSKIEAGRMEVEWQQVDLVPMLVEIAETTRILVGEKNVAVELETPAETVSVTTDPIKLRQIVTNLASNASKFTSQGKIGIALRSDGEMVRIEVRDTGIGIREDDLKVLFTAFGQVEDPTTKRHEGTGLGLAISKNLVRMIGGKISVESSYGEGSRFTVSLPQQRH